jgi:hypothetical protein
MMTMKRARRNVAGDEKVNEKLQDNYITATGDTQDLRHDIQKLLWLRNWKNWELVVRQLMRLHFHHYQQKLC